jgi:hypothetical protein
MTPAMTHLCCPDCRLRFIRAAAYLDACPECDEPLRASSLRDTVGFRLFGLEDVPPALPQALAASIPVPDPGGARA